MGINIILPLIMGIAMTVIIGSQVAPSYIEKIKIAKVENRTISNQNLIKDAIVRYIKMEGKIPTKLDDLKTLLLMENQHNDNLFNGDYTYELVKLPDGRYNGVLKIFTTINDEGAGKYFSNSFKFPSKPKCVEIKKIIVNGVNVESCKDNLWETFYLLDEDTFKSIPVLEVGSIEWVKDKYSEDNLGKKIDEATLVGGEKDYAYNEEKNTLGEYVYNNTTKEWDKIDEVVGIEDIVIDKVNGNIISLFSFDNMLKRMYNLAYQHLKDVMVEDGSYSYVLHYYKDTTKYSRSVFYLDKDENNRFDFENEFNKNGDIINTIFNDNTINDPIKEKPYMDYYENYKNITKNHKLYSGIESNGKNTNFGSYGVVPNGYFGISIEVYPNVYCYFDTDEAKNGSLELYFYLDRNLSFENQPCLKEFQSYKEGFYKLRLWKNELTYDYPELLDHLPK